MTSQAGFFDETFDAEHLPDPLPPEPFALFEAWFADARARAGVPNSNAMCLSTVDAAGQPSSRMVLCKEIVAADGVVIFYTNYRSRKGRELEANPRCALLFHWDVLGRQVRIEGRVTRAPDAKADAYFATRPWESRLGAHASDQSQPIASRDALLEKVTEKAMELNLDLSAIVDGRDGDVVIPRPAHWGGYCVWASAVELWCNGSGRVHERARWERDGTPGDGAARLWRVTRLQP